MFDDSDWLSLDNSHNDDSGGGDSHLPPIENILYDRFYGQFSIRIIKLLHCLFILRARDRARAGVGTEREGDRIRSSLQALSCQHRARRGARTHGPRDHDLSRAEVGRSTD